MVAFFNGYLYVEYVLKVKIKPPAEPSSTLALEHLRLNIMTNQSHVHVSTLAAGLGSQQKGVHGLSIGRLGFGTHQILPKHGQSQICDKLCLLFIWA